MNILTIDGGGIRGAFAASALETLCDKIPRFFDEFDVVAGTSTGAIIAAVIAVGKDPADITTMYRNHAKEIFSTDPFRTQGALRSKYDQLVLKRVIEKELGKITLGELKKRVLISASNITTGKIELFDSSLHSHKKLTLAEVALASAAAPGYFDPVKIAGSVYADGGLWAIDPTAPTLIYLLNEGVQPEDITLLSVGTGYTKKMYSPPKKGHNWGLLNGWKGMQLLNLFTSLQSSYSEFVIAKIADHARYYKLNAHVEELAELDNVHVVDEYIELGKKEGSRAVQKVKSLIRHKRRLHWIKRILRTLSKSQKSGIDS